MYKIWLQRAGWPVERLEKQVLQDVQRLEARPDASLFHLQSLHLEHGPPLSLDQQLRWILQPQVLRAALGPRSKYRERYKIKDTIE